MHGNLVHADRGGHWTSTRYFTPHILFKVFLAKHCTSSIALIPLFRPVLPARIGYSWGYNVTSAVFKLLYKPRVAENWSQVLVPLRWWPGLRIQMFPEDISPTRPCNSTTSSEYNRRQSRRLFKASNALVRLWAGSYS
ncbi:hypothetical protein DHEL01_v201476 [Diaporthe helianthi]|uniref:Uncharacterized protein n=1 Tax=Diaporthe helianthi TaxID=158607 RepID=A0A2P5ICB0_DIAHE|nr:hypothetical protein DHEL01_v201476 [Diaporthe helianthi]